MPIEWRFLLPVIVICGGLYLITISPSISMVDTGLFMMVCDANGIAHPPGYPLATLLCHPFMSLPFEGAIPGNLFSTVFAVLTLGVMYHVCRRLDLSTTEAAVAAVMLGVSTAFWSQSIVLEVYTLNTFIFLVMMLCCLKFAENSDHRWLVLGSVFVGLGLANHWPLIVLSALGLIPILFSRWDVLLDFLRKPKWFVAGLLAFLVGISPYALMFTKAGNPMTMIGEVHNVSDLWLYFSRSTFQDNFLTRPEGWQGLLWWVPLASIKQFGYLGLVLIPVGMVRAVFELKRPIMWALVIIWLANCLLLPLLNNGQFNELFRTYFPTWILIGLVSCAVWMVLGLRYLIAFLPRADRFGLVVGIAAASLVTFQSYGSLGHQDANWVERYNRLLLESLDENAVLIVAGDTQTGPLGYLHYVQGERPDVELRQQHNMLYANRLAHPRSPALMQAQLLDQYIRDSGRTVYVISELGEGYTDFGMYYRIAKGDAADFGFNDELDAYMQALVPVLATGTIREPFIRPYLENLVFQYARAVVGDAITSRGLSELQLARLQLVAGTLQGKVWTLHHFVNGSQQVDPAQLQALITEGLQQLGEHGSEAGARQFLLLAGDANYTLLGEQAAAFELYQQARAFDVNRETCKYLQERMQQDAYSNAGC